MGDYYKELPPRTRRIRIHDNNVAGQPGTTSAHAENTHHPHTSRTSAGNYLRARGEYRCRCLR